MHDLTIFTNRTNLAILLFLAIALAVIDSSLVYSKIAYAAFYKLRSIPSICHNRKPCNEDIKINWFTNTM